MIFFSCGLNSEAENGRRATRGVQELLREIRARSGHEAAATGKRRLLPSAASIRTSVDPLEISPSFRYLDIPFISDRLPAISCNGACADNSAGGSRRRRPVIFIRRWRIVDYEKRQAASGHPQGQSAAFERVGRQAPLPASGRHCANPQSGCQNAFKVSK